MGNTEGSNKREERTPRREKENLTFTPLPMTYVELYAKLYKVDIVRPYYVTPFKPPFPAWYDEKAHCEYHGGTLGHSIENYVAFKKFVQGLINNGILKIDDQNAGTNPLPNHENRGVNAIMEDGDKKTKTNVSEVKTSFRKVFQQLCMARLIDKGMVIAQEGCGIYCEFHQGKDHDIENCGEFKQKIQSLMDNKEVEFFEKNIRGEAVYICASDNSPARYGMVRPFVISSRPRTSNPTGGVRRETPKLTISTPTSFPYKDTKKVPWNYTANVSVSMETKPKIDEGVSK